MDLNIDQPPTIHHKLVENEVNLLIVIIGCSFCKAKPSPSFLFILIVKFHTKCHIDPKIVRVGIKIIVKCQLNGEGALTHCLQIGSGKRSNRRFLDPIIISSIPSKMAANGPQKVLT